MKGPSSSYFTTYSNYSHIFFEIGKQLFVLKLLPEICNSESSPSLLASQSLDILSRYILLKLFFEYQGELVKLLPLQLTFCKRELYYKNVYFWCCHCNRLSPWWWYRQPITKFQKLAEFWTYFQDQIIFLGVAFSP